MADVAFVTDSLAISQAIEILQSPPADQCISNPPVSVKGGEVYIFRGENPENQGNHTSCKDDFNAHKQFCF